jgi:metallo-beta-lactamase family protein
MELTFIGATQTVTGSMHLVSVNGKKILLDCGMYQGKRIEANERNRNFPFDPKSIDAVILSHAHIDHSGSLPSLVKRGFDGTIYSTPATRDLCSVMLIDSAYIQEKDAEYFNKQAKKNGKQEIEPIYAPQDVLNTLGNFQTVPYHKEFRVCDGVKAQFFDAGHIIGSAGIRLTATDNGKTTTLGFSGDIGRRNLPIIKDPEFMGDVNYLIMESTYGGVKHDPPDLMENQLERIIRRALEKGGKIIIPAFSVGRTQDIVYTLYKLSEAGKLPQIPIFVDSPLSVNITEVYKLHPECFDKETASHILQRHDPFGFNQIRYIQNTQDSKALNDKKGTYIIISASGMCEAGRVLHHLANNVEDSRNTILFVGYTAEHTLGRRIVERQPEIKIFDKFYRLNADVEVLESFSAHADGSELLKYATQFNSNILKKLFIVHGETERSEYFKKELEARNYKNISIPTRGEKFKLA